MSTDSAPPGPAPLVAGGAGAPLPDPETVEAAARAAIARDAGDLRARLALAAALHARRRLPEALEAYRDALGCDRACIQAHNGCAVVLGALGRAGQAIEHLRAAVVLTPGDPLLHSNLGVMLEQAGRPREALQAYDAALAIDAAFAPALMNRAPLLAGLGQLDAAAAAAIRFAAVYPHRPEAHFNLAAVLRRRREHAAAVAAYDACLELEPDHADAHRDRGLTLALLGRHAEADAAFVRAGRADPSIWADTGGRVTSARDACAPDSRAIYLRDAVHRLRRCDWSGYDALLDGLLDAARGRDGRGTPEPEVLFPVWATPLGAQVNDLVAARFAREVEARVPPRLWSGRSPPGRRLRIGYLSPDLREHAGGYFARALLRRHDRERFELRAYSIAPDDGGAVRADVRQLVDAFVDLDTVDDAEAAWRIFRDGCDVLVDIAGYSGRARPGILAYRPADIQVQYHGFQASMHADFIDYHVTSVAASPIDEAPHWTEARVFLPHTHYVYDPDTRVSEVPAARAAHGLPENAVVLCCFNQPFKIDPESFDAWVRVAAGVPGAVLWLLVDEPAAERALRGEARARGLDPGRLVFAPREPDRPRHLARMRLADLYLDPFWFNGHTSALDALRVDLPLITRAGNTPYGRLAASFLAALGMSDLVAPTTAAFVALGVHLGTDAAAREAARERVRRGRRTEPLFDVARRTRALESAYAEMVRRQRAGEMPCEFQIDPVSLAPRPL